MASRHLSRGKAASYWRQIPTSFGEREEEDDGGRFAAGVAQPSDEGAWGRQAGFTVGLVKGKGRSVLNDDDVA